MWKITACEDRIDFHSCNLVDRTENCADSTDSSTVVENRLDCLFDRFTGCDGRCKDQNLFVLNHSLFVVTEQDLSVLG